MKFKKIVENWNRHLTNEVVDPEWQEVFDDIAADMGLGRTHPVARDIMINAGADLDIPGMLALLRRAGIPAKMAEDPQFLVAWITGRLPHLGGPTLKRAKQKFGDHTKAKLFSKYSDVKTKYDKAQARPTAQVEPKAKDLPSDGLTPVDPSVYDTHSGGKDDTPAPAGDKVSVSSVIPALKQILRLDYSQGLDAENADRVMSIIMTAIDALERGE
jgi:hypothetical protein